MQGISVNSGSELENYAKPAGSPKKTLLKSADCTGIM